MTFFWKKNYFLTLFLDSGKNCFRHLASFFMQVCHTCTLLVQANFFSEKSFFWNCFNNCVEWSVLGKKTFSKGTHNFTFFCQIMSKTFLGVWQENLEQVCWRCILLGQRILSRVIFIEERSILQYFRTSSEAPAVIRQKLFNSVVNAAF